MVIPPIPGNHRVQHTSKVQWQSTEQSNRNSTEHQRLEQQAVDNRPVSNEQQARISEQGAEGKEHRKQREEHTAQCRQGAWKTEQGAESRNRSTE